MIPAAGAVLAYGIAVALARVWLHRRLRRGSGLPGSDQARPRGGNRLTEEVGRRAQRGHVHPLRSDPARTRARGSELGARPLRSPQPDRRAHGARGDRDAWARVRGCRRSLSSAGSARAGLASIVFAVIVIEESQLPHEHLLVLAIYLTVGLSVVAHGLTAAPLAKRYAEWFERHPRDKRPRMESAPSEVTGPAGCWVRPRKVLDTTCLV